MGAETLKLSYDTEDGILYMHFKDGPSSKVSEDCMIIELDCKEVIGIEVWGIRNAVYSNSSPR